MEVQLIWTLQNLYHTKKSLMTSKIKSSFAYMSFENNLREFFRALKIEHII